MPLASLPAGSVRRTHYLVQAALRPGDPASRPRAAGHDRRHSQSDCRVDRWSGDRLSPGMKPPHHLIRDVQPDLRPSLHPSHWAMGIHSTASWPRSPWQKGRAVSAHRYPARMSRPPGGVRRSALASRLKNYASCTNSHTDTLRTRSTQPSSPGKLRSHSSHLDAGQLRHQYVRV